MFVVVLYTGLAVMVQSNGKAVWFGLSAVLPLLGRTGFFLFLFTQVKMTHTRTRTDTAVGTITTRSEVLWVSEPSFAFSAKSQEEKSFHSSQKFRRLSQNKWSRRHRRKPSRNVCELLVYLTPALITVILKVCMYYRLYILYLYLYISVLTRVHVSSACEYG